MSLRGEGVSRATAIILLHWRADYGDWLGHSDPTGGTVLTRQRQVGDLRTRGWKLHHQFAVPQRWLGPVPLAHTP